MWQKSGMPKITSAMYTMMPMVIHVAAPTPVCAPRSARRLVGGNPDFTNAPGHGDDDARFYDRQQAYVHAPDIPPRPPGRDVAPKPELTLG